MAEQADRINTTSLRFRDFCVRNPAAPTLHIPISDDNLTRLDHDLLDNNIPMAEASNQNDEHSSMNKKCCCGSAECAYQDNDHVVLRALEKDLETAARLGQALLERHETYVKESQAEQIRLSSHVTELEHKNAFLQSENHKVVVENKELLQKLEELNNSFGESGQRVNDLENLLQDCDSEIRRLNTLARKTQELELKMLDMERERMELNKQVEEGKLESRSHIARWKESEKKIRELEHEIQKIEFEASLDREKHDGIVARMAKERTLERELGVSEGRLKATAAVQNMRGSGPNEKQVVSNFVRDILQDNANLQAGISELRGLLQSSNDEVQILREQVMTHQPMLDETTPTQQRTLSLSDELGLSQSLPQQVQQELHVHHHYHSKATPRKEKAVPLKRNNRRRAIMPTTALSSSPSSGTSTPLIKPYRHISSPVIPLSLQSSNTKANRWSMQSNTTTSTYMSSMASSPRSYLDRGSSLFDRMEAEEETSRPTSPDSLCISSPIPFKRRDRPNGQSLSTFAEESPIAENEEFTLEAQTGDDTFVTETDLIDSNELPDAGQRSNTELTPKPSMALKSAKSEVLDRSPFSKTHDSDQPPGLGIVELPDNQSSTFSDEPVEKEASELQNDISNENSTEDEPVRQYFSTYSELPEIRPSIRRSNSLESLVSISGMDIHLAQHNRPGYSALTLLRAGGANKHHFAPSPASTRKVSTTQPVAAVTEFTATSRPGLDHQPSASMLALSGIARSNTSQYSTANNRGLMGSVGGWVSRKWGTTPTKSTLTPQITPVNTTAMNNVFSPSLSSSSSTRSNTAVLPNIQSTPTTALKHRNTTDSFNTTASSTPSKPPSTNRSVSITTTTSDDPGLLTSTSKPILVSTTSDRQARGKQGSISSAAAFSRRAPGINQFGPIPGFAAAVAARKAPTEVEAKEVNLSGLQESLVDH